MRQYITDKKKGKVLNRLSLAVLTGFLVFYISLWHTFLQNPSDHGRIETKEISILNAEDVLNTDLKRKWPHVHSVIRVRTSRIYKSSGVQTEDREDKFFVSSITPDGLDDSFAATMQDIILSRWQIESHHWVIDVVFGQDALPLRNKEYIENSTVYTKIACNVLSYIREHVPYYNGKPWSFESLQILARKAQTS